jgi:hypothetical protein
MAGIADSVMIVSNSDSAIVDHSQPIIAHNSMAMGSLDWLR